ncbi:hypothetical protein [Hahella ganghwensis]|uniref:hypothetical protein n=1 Tax=Hahella ganghwensis TaxID=286420 RepID=UPI000371A4C1|nr:hypothetical protein [Hahella ganghwensis]
MAPLFRRHQPNTPKQNEDGLRTSDSLTKEAGLEKNSAQPRLEWEMSAVAALRVNFVTSEN